MSFSHGCVSVQRALQALVARASLVRVHRRQPSMSAPKKVGVSPPGDSMLVGVQVDPAAALQLRDMGPPADDVQVSSHEAFCLSMSCVCHACVQQLAIAENTQLLTVCQSDSSD